VSLVVLAVRDLLVHGSDTSEAQHLPYAGSDRSRETISHHWTLLLLGTTDDHNATWAVLHHLPVHTHIVSQPLHHQAAVILTNHFRYSWDTSITGGKCQPMNVLTYIYYATTAVNIAIDW
jgi:hypothetical protein